MCAKNQIRLFLASLLLIGSAAVSFGQSAPAAERDSTLAVFGTYTHTMPDYGGSANGGSFGVDYSPFLGLPLHPAIEARASFAHGPSVNENTYLFGPRVGFRIAERFHPYGLFLIGYGKLHYNFNFPNAPNYHDDDSIVKSLGVGVDVDLKHGLQAKGEWRYEFWNLGSNYNLTPSNYSIGLAYRFGNRHPHHPTT